MGDVRLVDGSSVSTEKGQGRVEVCSVNGIWGTVCAESDFNNTDADVICRQIGFKGTGMLMVYVRTHPKAYGVTYRHSVGGRIPIA